LQEEQGDDKAAAATQVNGEAGALVANVRSRLGEFLATTKQHVEGLEVDMTEVPI